MLKITKVVKNEDQAGDYTGNWRLTESQTEFLLTYAINQLLLKGLAEVEEVEETPNE